MNQPGRKFTDVLITRPQPDADDLARMLANAGVRTIVQPAQEFRQRLLTGTELDEIAAMSPPFLVVFTSPRAVEYGLSHLPPAVTANARYAAIGPATARAMSAAGRPVHVQPGGGYTSEALLEELNDMAVPEGAGALVVCAPGGREVLVQRLGELGWDSRPVWVYERLPVEIGSDALESIASAGRLLTVFTSGEAMNALSQRLPPSAWYAVCRGEWLVISDRLQRVARAFGPADIHVAGGPGNAELVTAIRSIY